jgi:hypothetical protein
VITLLLEIEEDPTELYAIRGSREKDRLRVICPNAMVNSRTALHARTLILERLGYKGSAEIIPSTMYRFHASIPTVLLERQYDYATKKKETHQSFICFFHKKMKTETLEKKLNRWATYNSDTPTKPLAFTKKYKSFLRSQTQHPALDEKETPFEEPPVNDLEEELFGAILQEEKEQLTNIPRKISAEVKKKLGDKIDRCVKMFQRYHPDSKLRAIRVYQEKFYLFDFSKSSKICQVCKDTHKGNRQYLVYSPDLQRAYYHCHDPDAKGKSLIWPMKDPPRGRNVVVPSTLDETE